MLHGARNIAGLGGRGLPAAGSLGCANQSVTEGVTGSYVSAFYPSSPLIDFFRNSQKPIP